MTKKVLLCVSSSISFYKAFELLSLLKKQNFDVYVAMSEKTLEFCLDLGFEALSKHKVLCAKNEDWTKGIDHISYSKVDLVIIAPATANSIAKIANGIADNLMLSAILASNAPKIIAPAMNTNMLNNEATLKNIKTLKNRGFEVVEPASKILACGDNGKGALAKIENIFYASLRALNKDKFYENKKVIITGGPTREKIDPVRVISNLSSGKMAKALADAFYFLGAEVILISSVKFEAPYELKEFSSSSELLEAINLEQNCDYLVMAAAVSDYLPQDEAKEKIKKTDSSLCLNLKENIDILGNLKLDCKKIGFKLESDKKSALKNAKNMLEKKNLNAVCLNILGDGVEFGSNETRINFITKDDMIECQFNSKSQIALEIAGLIKKL